MMALSEAVAPMTPEPPAALEARGSTQRLS